MFENMKKKSNEVFLKENYPNIRRLRVEPLEHNDLNSKNYLVYSDRKKFILKQLNRKINHHKIKKMCEIMEICKKNKVPVPIPIYNIRGKYFEQTSNVLLLKYFEGEFFDGTKLEIIDLAKNIAKLHKVLSNISITYNFHTNSNQYDPLTFQEFEKINTVIDKKYEINQFDRNVRKNMRFLIKETKKDDKISQEIKKVKFKKQLIHHDLHPENVIFNKNKVAVILDFLSMQKGFRIEDIAMASFRFALFKTKNHMKIKKIIKLFVNTYKENNNVHDSEIYYLEYFFRHETIRRISFILKNYYFRNSDLWNFDFKKHTENLKIIKDI